MTRKTTFVHNGETLQGEAHDFEATKEHWNEYKLEDGATVRVKLVPVDIIRATEKLNETGDPVVLVQASIIIQYRRSE